jgi:hypothetical protein
VRRLYKSFGVKGLIFLILGFCSVVNVVFFLMGDSPAFEFYVPTFRNTLCSIFLGRVKNQLK